MTTIRRLAGAACTLASFAGALVSLGDFIGIVHPHIVAAKRQFEVNVSDLAHLTQLVLTPLLVPVTAPTSCPR